LHLGDTRTSDILDNPGHDKHREVPEWLGLNDATQIDPAAVPTEDIDYELALSGGTR
jgi:hypothetical protein